MDNVALSTQITASLFGFNSTCPDDPYGGSSGVGITIPGWGNGVWGTQIVFDYNGRAPFFRTFFSFGQSVGDWIKLATATPPQEFDLPLAEGVTSIGAGYKNTYSKDQFGIVRVWFSVHFESIQASGTHVFNLPEGFRPDSTCYAAAVLSMAEYYNAIVAIHPSGDALVEHGTIGQTGPINLHGFIEFPAN